MLSSASPSRCAPAHGTVSAWSRPPRTWVDISVTLDADAARPGFACPAVARRDLGATPVAAFDGGAAAARARTGRRIAGHAGRHPRLVCGSADRVHRRPEDHHREPRGRTVLRLRPRRPGWL